MIDHQDEVPKWVVRFYSILWRLLQDTEGRWWGMNNGYHRMLEHYGKIVKE